MSASRLKGKPLLKINNLPIICHVLNKAKKTGIESFVATEDKEIISAVEQNGTGSAILTGNHKTGTDRIFEAFQKLKTNDVDYVLNLQGDEPMIDPNDIINLNNLMIENNRGENSIFLAINKHVPYGIIQTLLATNPELFFTTYLDNTGEEDSPLRYVKKLLQRVIDEDNNVMIDYYGGLEELLDCFYIEYDNYYTSESNPMRLTSLKVHTGGNWSKDGSRVVFTVEDTYQQGTNVRNPNGVNEYRLTTTIDSNPMRSPVANKIAYVSETNYSPDI